MTRTGAKSLHRPAFLIASLLVIIGLSGCSVSRIAAKAAFPILEAGTLAFESESDPVFAEAAAPSNLKLLEGLVLEAPEDRDLLTLASRGYATYAFGFLEHDLEAARIDNPGLVPDLERRMEDFYGRSFEYGRRALRRGLADELYGSDEAFQGALDAQKVSDVPQLFWTAYSLGALIQLDVTDADRLSVFPRVKAMMTRVVELDETYYFAGAHLFFGVLYAQLPPGGGGDTQASMSHFDRAHELIGDNLLMLDVLKARYLSVRLQDHQMYVQSLERALTTADSPLPEAMLANQLARIKADFYINNADAFFLDIPADNQDWFPMTPDASNETSIEAASLEVN